MALVIPSDSHLFRPVVPRRPRRLLRRATRPAGKEGWNLQPIEGADAAALSPELTVAPGGQ